jgi:asparagine synthase (glutamine-hydrolysing)
MRVTREDAFDVQPLRELDGDADLIITADARIDNRAELAETLGIAPAMLDRMADSALILASYRRWGEDLARHLLGDFAFAIWDGAAGKLILARDHMGQRYIHHHHGAGFFAFATEAKGLHALRAVPRALDEAVIMRSLLFDFHARDGSTHFAGIKGIPGGSSLVVESDGRARLDRYWRPHAAPEHVGRDAAYYVATYRRLLGEAVGCRIRRLAAPPGLLLSGGFDSAAIAALTAAYLPPAGKLVAATSALTEGSGQENLAHDARQGAEWCAAHMPHLDHAYFVRNGESILDDADALNHVHDGLPNGLDYVFTGLLRHLRSRGARLAMDGIGGDATLNSRGMRQLPNLLAAGKWRAFAHALRHECRVTGHGPWHILRRRVLPHTPAGRWVRERRAARRETSGWWHRYANAALRDTLHASGSLCPRDLIPTRDRVSDAESRRQTLELCQSRAQPNGANEAAALGLELSRPMFDKRIVEFGLAIPEELLIVRGRRRWLAIQALGDLLPPAFSTRRRGQEHLDPDHEGMMRAAMPDIHTMVTRMRDREARRGFIDFDTLAHDTAPQNSARLSAAEIVLLGRAFVTARYIAWFRRENM